MLPVRVGNVSARVIVDGLPQLEREAVLEWFDDYLTVECAKWLRQGGRPRRKTERIPLFNINTGKSPRGLLPKLVRAAREDALDGLEGRSREASLRLLTALEEVLRR